MSVLSARARLRAGIGSALAVCLALSAVLLFGAPTHAATERVLDEDLVPSSAIAVHTSTGRTLELSIDIDHSPSCRQCSPASTDYDLTLATPKDSEDHTWRLWPNSASDFTGPKDGAAGSISSGDELGPYATIELTLTPIGDADNDVCGTTVEDSTQKVAITGSLFLNTKSSTWGTLGTRATPMSISTSGAVATVYDAPDTCSTPSGPSWAPCDFEASWFVDGAVLGAGGAGKQAWFAISANGDLPGAPKGSYRDDEYSTTVGSATMTTKGKTATIKLKGNGSSTTGTATIKAGHRSVDRDVVCGKKRHPFVDTRYLGRFAQGKKPLTLHSRMLGPIRIKNSQGPGSAATIEVTRKS